MPDDSLSPADKAVVAFFEIVAFALGWAGVDRFLAGTSLFVVAPIFIATVLTSYTGFKWPQIKRKCASRVGGRLELPENRPRVLPKEYGKHEQLGSHGLFVRNPGYDALEVRIPSVLIGTSMYRLIFPERLAILSERDSVRFLEASLQHMEMLPGVDGSSLHDVMRKADVDHLNFSILYKDTDFLKYKTKCIIERTNRTRNGLEVRATGQELISDAEWELSDNDNF